MTNTPPQEQYADEWEQAKMPETSPGSNIYEKTVTLSTFNQGILQGTHFRFYYDLAKGLPDYDASSYFMNLIQPRKDGSANIDRVIPPMAGNSGIYGDAPVDKLSVAQYADNWQLPEGTYKLRVDLNTMTFRAIPDDTVLMLVNDESDPATGIPADYTEITRMKNYVEPCDNLRIRLYDIFNNKWLNPRPGYENLNPGNDGSVAFFGAYQTSDSKGSPFTLTGWKGGVITGSYDYDYRATFASDEAPEYIFTPISPDAIYAVGDFSSWTFKAVDKENGSDAIYNVILPAGTQEFKLLLAPEWGADEIGVGAATTSGNSIVYEARIAANGGLGNSSFASALTAPATIVINLTRGTVTVPADLNLTIPYVTIGGAVAPVERDAMFVVTPYDSFTPWKDCSDAVLSSFPSLAKQEDGTYSGNIYVPAGQFKLNFISELTDRNLPNKVIAPPTGNDRAIVVADRMACSSAAELTADNAGYWTYNGLDNLKGWGGGTVNISVTPGSSPSVKFDLSSVLPDENLSQIYLVGTPNNWDIFDGSMPLRLTTTGGYYGSYAIDDTEATFRFYTSLGDWGNNASLPSIGASPNDNNLSEVFVNYDTEYRGSCTPGKGSWNLYGWTAGETLYMYVHPGKGLVIFSQEPITEAGGFADLYDKDLLYIYQNGEYRELEKGDDGFYRGNLYKAPFRLFTKKLPISPEETQWAGSYALVIPCKATSLLDLDQFNVAEFTVTANDGISTDGGTEFICPELPEVPWPFTPVIAVNPETGKVYVEYPGTHYYLCGKLTDGKLPTYETRADFAAYHIPARGGIVDIPAGKMDFSFVRSIADAFLYTPIAEVEFTDGIAHIDTSNPENFRGWEYRNVVCRDWQGGKVMVSPTQMLDMSTVSDLQAVAAKDNLLEGFTSTLTQTAPGSLIYKGSVDFSDHTNPYLRFVLYSNPSEDLYSVVSADVSFSSSGIVCNPEDAILIPKDGVMNGKAAFNTYCYFSMPSLVGDGSMEVTLDLNTMTVKAVVSSENEGSIYETVADEDSGLDGVTAYPSTNQDGAVVASADVSGNSGESYGFNFTTPAGEVLQPENGIDTPVEFDEDGTWSGTFTSTAAQASSRRAVRAAAAQAARWHFTMPEGKSGKIHILIDEKSSRLTIFSEAHNSNFFIVTATTATGIEQLGSMKRNMLRHTSDGIYAGTVDIPGNVDGTFTVMLASDCALNSGIFTPIYSLTTFDLTNNMEASLPAVTGSFPTSWTLTAPAGKVSLRYDAREGLLSASRDEAGVENVSANSDNGLTVKAVDGAIIITAARATHVNIYSVTGLLVRSLDILPGMTTVSLAPGFYIVNDHKVLVR